MTIESGHRLGPYEIRRRIGAGGMGEVYSAFDTRLRRAVAIKMIRARETTAASRARLEREARAVAALSHPNVLSIFDIGNEGDSIYVVTELLEGHTLREALANGPLPVDSAVAYTRQIAAALASAHAKGIVHRDIKPENLFITNDGQLKVLDFGLARAADHADAVTAVQDERLTAPDTILGTMGYMSPEQLRGESIDGRSDLFALGCVLYEMLRGSPPFDRPTRAATIGAILNEDPDCESIKSAPPFVIAALKRMLAKVPGDRFASANDLTRALDSPQRFWSKGRVAAAAAIFVVIGSIAVVRSLNIGGSSGAGAKKSQAMLAVLPFENIGSDPAQEYFSDGLTEETITEFARLNPSQLSVIARSSTMRYKKVRADVRTIARELGADYLLEGSVRRAGDRMRVSAQLVRASDGAEIWGDSYDRMVDDVLAMQAELARGVAAAVQIKVAPDRVKPKTNPLPDVPAAREAYLRGRYYLHLGSSENRRKAVESMREAVALEPASAAAHAGLASALLSESTLDYPPRQIIEQARASVQKALQLDDGIAEAHEALGLILLEYDWKWDDAERELKRALTIDPNLAAAHLDYATLLITSGRTAEGLDELKRGRELDPVSASTNRDGLFNLYCTRRYDDAYQQARHAIELEPRNDFAYSIIAVVELSRGQNVAAAAAADRVIELKGSQTARSIAAYAFANLGRQNDARQVLQNIEAESQKKFACYFNVAALYIALGEPDRAFAAMNRAYGDRTA